MKRLLTIFALLLLPVLIVAQSKQPAQELAALLEKVQTALDEGRAQAAVDLLNEWKGDDHAHRQLLLGHARMRLEQHAQAQDAYRTALNLDPTLRPATLGLANCALAEQRWKDALALLAPVIDIRTADAGEISAYARAAYETGDFRLSALIVEQGMLRFPADMALRRLDLSLLNKQERFDEAQDAALALLRESPAESQLWNALAFAARETSNDERSLAAIEAAALLAPKDIVAQQRHISAQLEAGHVREALAACVAATGQDWASIFDANPGFAELCIAVAERAEALSLARVWIDSIPAGKRSAQILRLAARIALRANDVPAAEAALKSLIEAGAADANAYWLLGSLLEKSEALSDAEVYYRHARARGYDLAALFLARLQHKLARTDDALRTLNEYIADHPADEQARAMLKLLFGSRE
ncbi:MAG: tetratricopeptide repeat protein [Planctomycetes bacterium]|nr:tetratricopeptide repeat protein [Planctomycetota bacterium]NUQ33828.1 tetratricopeptide repeat protein [Planctomycetaceae bacterium]